LFHNSDHVDLLAVQQDVSFDSLDRALQHFIKHLASCYSNLSDLILQENITTRSTVTREQEATRHHVTSAFQDMQISVLNGKKCARFLESLYYLEFQERQEEISEAYEQTLKWIFDRTGVETPLWGNFVKWLGKSNGIYWISVKSGSGKSTLINFITTDNRTTESLKVWGNTSRVLTPRFFFWNAGTNLQKSSLGLLRSLLYQILSDQQEVVPELLDS
jgi:hypothetical protein